MRRVLTLRRYPTVVVFMLAGVCAILLAFSSYNLFQMSMTNLEALRLHGLFATMDNRDWDLMKNGVWGAFCLLVFLCFKACEIELMQRYRIWMDRAD